MLAGIVAVTVVSCTLAYSQTADFGTDFAFVAGDKTLPAGKYMIQVLENNLIRISGPGGEAAMVINTRLGRHDDDTELELVFDKVGDKLLLSEVWYPGKDGYLLLSTKQAHEHAVLRGLNRIK